MKKAPPAPVSNGWGKNIEAQSMIPYHPQYLSRRIKDALIRLEKTGIPLDTDRWGIALELYRWAIRDDPVKLEKFGRQPFFWWEYLTDEHGRLHSTWGDVPGKRCWTTRIQARKPNVQAIPRGVLRECIRNQGSLILSADWSGSHLRILADRSEDTGLIADLVDGDPYLAIVEVLGLDPAVDRSRVKDSILALLNGEGRVKRRERLPKTGDLLPGIMAARWPKAMRFLKTCSNRIKASDLRFTTPTGTQVTVPFDKSHAIPAGLLQAIEADAMRRVIPRAHALEDQGLPIKLIAPIHDEIVCEVTEPGRIEEIAALTQEIMSDGLGVRAELRPGACKVSWGPSFGQQDRSTGDPRPFEIPEGLLIHKAKMMARNEKEITAIVGGLGDQGQIQARLAQIKAEEVLLIRRFDRISAEPSRGEPISAERKVRALELSNKGWLDTLGVSAGQEDLEAIGKAPIHPATRGALKATEHARVNLEGVRADVFTKVGYTFREEGCGRLPQWLQSSATKISVHIQRNCAKKTCSWCGPWQIGLELGALLFMPILDKGTVVGRPLSERPVYRFDVDNKDLQAFRKAYNRVAVKVRRSQGVRKTRKDKKALTCFSDKTSKLPSEPNKEHDALVVFRRPNSGRKSAALSTVQKVGKAQGILVPSEGLEGLVYELATDHYRPIVDIPDPDDVYRSEGDTSPIEPDFIFRKKINTSRGLNTDPRAIRKQAFPNDYTRLDKGDLCSPGEGARRMKELAPDHHLSPTVEIKDPSGREIEAVKYPKMSNREVDLILAFLHKDGPQVRVDAFDGETDPTVVDPLVKVWTNEDDWAVLDEVVLAYLI